MEWVEGVKSGSETFEVGGPPALPPKRQRPSKVELLC